MNEDILKGYITGLIEGEGCFNIAIQKARPQFRMPFEIRPLFVIWMNIREKEMLDKLKEVIGVGNVFIRKNKRLKLRGKEYNGDFVVYQISGLRNCKTLIRYLDSVEFLGFKKKTYALWKEAIRLIKDNQHGTKEGILEIAKIRDEMSPQNLRNYRDHGWFKNYLEKNYPKYKPSSKFVK